MMMGIIWWVYGIGLKGNDPAWKGNEVIGGTSNNAGSDIVRGVDVTSATATEAVDGLARLAEDNPGFGQATAAADDILVNQTQVFKAGDYKASPSTPRAVERWPKIRSRSTSSPSCTHLTTRSSRCSR